MGRRSQQKGRRGEIELRDILRKYGFEEGECGEPQSYGAVPDLVGLHDVHVEAKRCEQMRLWEWMQQAVRDAERFKDGVPVLFHRRNRQGWLVTMNLADWVELYRKK